MQNKDINNVKTGGCANTCGDLIYLPGVLSLKLIHTTSY